jgi:hypothetical protein
MSIYAGDEEYGDEITSGEWESWVDDLSCTHACRGCDETIGCVSGEPCQFDGYCDDCDNEIAEYEDQISQGDANAEYRFYRDEYQGVEA